MRTTVVCTLLACIFSVSNSSTLLAAPIVTVPAGLQPGDQYRLVFLAIGDSVATSSDIAQYNTIVTLSANVNPALKALGTTFSVIGSTATVDARDNTGTNPTLGVGVPIYRLDGLRVADNNADLWDGSIANPILYQANGVARPVEVWTGSGVDGRRDPWDGGSSFGTTHPTFGFANMAGSGWVYAGSQYDGFGRSYTYYGMSGVLTVVPEPSSIVLAAFAGIGLLCACRRRRD